MNFAIVQDDTVFNIIVCETQQLAEELTQMEVIPLDELPLGASLGWIRKDGVWQNQPQIAVEETTNVIEE